MHEIFSKIYDKYATKKNAKISTKYAKNQPYKKWGGKIHKICKIYSKYMQIIRRYI